MIWEQVKWDKTENDKKDKNTRYSHPFLLFNFFCKLLRCISKERSFIKTTRKKRSRQEDKRSGHTTVQGAIKDFQSLTMYRATKQVISLLYCLSSEWLWGKCCYLIWIKNYICSDSTSNFRVILYLSEVIYIIIVRLIEIYIYKILLWAIPHYVATRNNENKFRGFSFLKWFVHDFNTLLECNSRPRSWKYDIIYFYSVPFWLYAIVPYNLKFQHYDYYIFSIVIPVV